ncbi:hypothetical protein L3Q82_020714, partial [Scortum barcoo]
DKKPSTLQKAQSSLKITSRRVKREQGSCRAPTSFLQLTANTNKQPDRRGNITEIPWTVSAQHGDAVSLKENRIVVQEDGYYLVFGQVLCHCNSSITKLILHLICSKHSANVLLDLQVLFIGPSAVMGHTIRSWGSGETGSTPTALLRCLQEISDAPPDNTCYTAVVVQFNSSRSSSRGRMVRHMLSHLLLLWSLSHDLYITGLTHLEPKEQSWNNQSLYSVPPDLDARLRRLDLSNNFIRQLHTLALPYLEQLDLSSNQLDLISEGAFENLDQLEELNLSRNALNNNLGNNSKALQSISRLRSLDVSMNGLRDDAAEMYLRNKSYLDQLKMTGNTLTRLSHNMFKESK